MSTFEQTEAKVIQWANDRQIVAFSNPLAQARKTLEETGELLEAASAMTCCEDYLLSGYQAEYKDALGDVLVTLIVGAACADVNLLDCLELAYEQIKDRKGHLRADGVFVKDAA
jgi:NTP pyrophosphatase (non-canonical NTP hydrolase)